MPKNYEGFITCSARQKYFFACFSLKFFHLSNFGGHEDTMRGWQIVAVCLYIRQAGKWIQIDFPQSDLFAVCVYIRQAG